MPCRDHEQSCGETDEALEDYTAALCAITGELKRRGIFGEVVEAAEAAGSCKIFQLCAEHASLDDIRMQKILGGLSVDERSSLRILLGPK